MKSLRILRLLLASSIALLVVFVPVHASAAPLTVERDRTDNGYSFSYDATNGEITQAASSIRFDRRDPVSFVIYVRENTKSEVVGERLRARLSLGLNGDRAVRYRGTFWFEITDVAGAIVYSDEVTRKIVLRPQPGARKAAMAFVFDLPSGSYNASGYFEATE